MQSGPFRASRLSANRCFGEHGRNTAYGKLDTVIPWPTIELRLRILTQYHLGGGEPELRLLGDLAKDCDLAIDVGANTGVFAFLLSRTSRAVLAFEPIPHHQERLLKALPPNCDVFCLALSNRDGESVLRIPQIGGRLRFSLASISNGNTFEGFGEVEGEAHYRIETATLDAVLSRSPYAGRKTGFIKIDVEGHEHEVIMGARQTIDTQRPTVLVETEFRHGAPVAEVFRFFDERGYKARSLVQGELASMDAKTLATMQSPEALAEKMLDASSPAYVNNIIFLPG
jgi:FkbM family methyltransferase